MSDNWREWRRPVPSALATAITAPCPALIRVSNRAGQPHSDQVSSSGTVTLDPWHDPGMMPVQPIMRYAATHDAA
jgi:hypothetical protein